MCLVQDDIKMAYIRRADVLTRQLLDARHSESRPPTAFEMIADRWNDAAFNPVAPASTCHEDFETAIDCSHTKVAIFMRATPQKVEDSLSSVRVNLSRVISPWEASGQGDGGHRGEEQQETTNDDSSSLEDYIIIDESSNRYGSLAGRSAEALDGRKAFLRGKPSYLLYFWELADMHQLLQTTMQRLHGDSGASDASSAPSVIGSHGTRRRRREDHEESEGPAEDILSLSQSLRYLADSENDRAHLLAHREDQRQVRHHVAELQDQARDYRRMYAEADDPTSTWATFYLEEAQRIALEIAALHKNSIATPVRHNTTPRT
jgi:hypothetical protein